MIVKRIEDENGSHIEPALGNHWRNSKKLRWKAAVTELDAGIPVQIVPMRRGRFIVNVGGSSTNLTFTEAWLYLMGVNVGANQS